jgi:hypothetical protein
VISPTQRPLPTQDNTTYKHNTQTSMPRAGFEHATPVTKRPKTYALDRAAAGFGRKLLVDYKDHCCRTNTFHQVAMCTMHVDCLCAMYTVGLTLERGRGGTRAEVTDAPHSSCIYPQRISSHYDCSVYRALTVYAI